MKQNTAISFIVLPNDWYLSATFLVVMCAILGTADVQIHGLQVIITFLICKLVNWSLQWPVTKCSRIFLAGRSLE